MKHFHSFDAAINAMPKALIASYDHQKTLADLAFMALHELDLYREGEDSDIRTKREEGVVQRWMERCRPAS